MKTSPLHPRFGVELQDVALDRLTPPEANDLTQLVSEHGLVLARRQALNDDQLLQLCSLLGTPDLGVNAATRSQGQQNIICFSNLRDPHNRSIGGQGKGDLVWHQDNYFRRKPTVSMLYGLILPTSGGATYWCSTRLPHLCVDAELKSRLGSLAGATPLAESVRAVISADTVRRPLVHYHPGPECECLYFSEFTESLDGLSPDASAQILDRLRKAVFHPDNIYQHNWQIGDLLLFDNSQLAHRRDHFSGPRFMKAARILVSGRRFPEPAELRWSTEIATKAAG